MIFCHAIVEANFFVKRDFHRAALRRDPNRGLFEATLSQCAAIDRLCSGVTTRCVNGILGGVIAIHFFRAFLNGGEGMIHRGEPGGQSVDPDVQGPHRHSPTVAVRPHGVNRVSSFITAVIALGKAIYGLGRDVDFLV